MSRIGPPPQFGQVPAAPDLKIEERIKNRDSDALIVTLQKEYAKRWEATQTWMAAVSKQFEMLTKAVVSREVDTGAVLDLLGVEFPDPEATQAAGPQSATRPLTALLVKSDVIEVVFRAARDTVAAAWARSVAWEHCGWFPHDLGRIPGWWSVVGNQVLSRQTALPTRPPANDQVGATQVFNGWTAGGEVRFTPITDVVLSSSVADETGTGAGNLPDSVQYAPRVAGYTGATTAIPPSITVTGSPAGTADGWISNRVQAGDKIKLSNVYHNNAADSVAVAAGSAVVTFTFGSGATLAALPAGVAVVAGWAIAFQATDTATYQIESIDSTTQLTLTEPLPTAVAAGTGFQILAADQEWREITAVTSTGVPDTLTLEEATEVPTGAGGAGAWGTTAQYIIKRPPTSTHIWLRATGVGLEDMIAASILLG